ncbi:MAG: alpha-amylase family glycosyl hydrolase [Acidimicrobiia bacterium]
MSNRRSSVNFAFGNFDIQGGFAVSHQYDRSLGVVRPWKPLTLRTTTVPEYLEVTAYVLEGLGPFTAHDIRMNGEAVPFYPSGGGWTATLAGRPDHTIVNYIVEAVHRSGHLHYADGRLPHELAKVFTHRVTSRRPPEWTNDAVVYQVFVDRFANANGAVAMPDDDHEFAGGDLHGVTSNLDWLSELGVNNIWLTPIFTCDSYHGYDSTDLKSIDPRFGGDHALKELVVAAHARGIRVLLDLVPNHISYKHPWFLSAQAGGPERDWFWFNDDDSYLMFFGSVTMPKVNLDHPDARAAVIDVATYWIEEFGIDGYRIDHALGPSESFFAALSEAVEALDPDVWLFGEVTATPQLSRRYGGVLDGVTDFPFAYALRELLAGNIDARDFAEIERESIAALDPADFSWVRFFDNHDMARAIHGWDNEREALEKAVDTLFSMQGVPSFFYGTEQALSHERSEAEGGLNVGRVPMSFNRDDPMFEHVRSAIARWHASTNAPDASLAWDDDLSGWTWGDLSGEI